MIKLNYHNQHEESFNIVKNKTLKKPEFYIVIAIFGAILGMHYYY